MELVLLDHMLSAPEAFFIDTIHIGLGSTDERLVGGQGGQGVFPQEGSFTVCFVQSNLKGACGLCSGMSDRHFRSILIFFKLEN